MSYPAISLATATVGCHRCPQKRLQTARQPPVYTNSSPDHRACNSLTPSAVLTPSIPVHRWIRGKCAQPGTPSEELEKFSAVFAGRAVTIQHSYDPKAASVSPEDRTTVGFEVSAVWKGTVHEDMYITTPPTGGSCGFTFVEGKSTSSTVTTVIMLTADTLLAYAVGPPSLGQAQADIDALGEGNAPQAGTGGPAPEEPQDTPLPSTGGYSPPVWATALVVGIGAALAAGGVGLMVHSRRLSRRRMDAVS